MTGVYGDSVTRCRFCHWPIDWVVKSAESPHNFVHRHTNLVECQFVCLPEDPPFVQGKLTFNGNDFPLLQPRRPMPPEHSGCSCHYCKGPNPDCSCKPCKALSFMTDGPTLK